MGREKEIDELVEVLSRRVKRNPLLVGPAGVGKTAIVEGFVQRVLASRVPRGIARARVIELSTSGLVATGQTMPELMKLMEKIIGEASQPDVVLFIDEFQAAVELGGPDLGIAGQMKPALARGAVVCIGALHRE